jgi:magnesium-transporting ATPase (P-type)
LEHEQMEKGAKGQFLKDHRDIRIGSQQRFFPDNSISTTKYTFYNFFFKNLFQQFTKMANLYFLFLACLQLIPAVTTSNGYPTYLFPLSFVVLLNMVKDGYEDYKRYKSDQEENNKESHVYRDGHFARVKWKDIRVGDLVMVLRDEFFPADLILLASSHFKKGHCFIETKNLDGETNLKTKYVCEELKGRIVEPQDVGVF